jgi:hypothetical protein
MYEHDIDPGSGLSGSNRREPSLNFSTTNPLLIGKTFYYIYKIVFANSGILANRVVYSTNFTMTWLSPCGAPGFLNVTFNSISFNSSEPIKNPVEFQNSFILS